ncbi:NADH:ubiquinone reductase (Na(+)-transporting) subunit C [Psittacicella hinzii]|uniref:Na(+)-translocating NADH-quinone reductase subunit C n=1 Tax=Psittacicella hinzii TaxID=2028575 RepID=A0A3A1Y5E0_9GAMM|nr:NADH:ubiquinone reductase (Na(+)-transporting) subunit C [Psittacicella hinzii]RIY31254.1 NADH:ubiquinone reductase (Na(+)-transporting) subunit C [Psittacicella hinzii]
MALNKNSTIYVTGFVALVSIVCAFIVALASTSLASKQQEQIEANTQRFVLKVSDINFTEQNLQSVFNQNIETRYVDRLTGTFVDPEEAVKKEYSDLLILNKFNNVKYRQSISSSENTPGLKNNLIANILQVYLVKNTETGKIEKVVLPFYGNGLWSVMYGLIAIDTADANTVTGLTYYQQGETPGLGGEVENPNFTKQFVGKKVYELTGANSSATVAKLSLVKNITDGQHQVNALTGATLTSNGVNNQLQFWLGDLGYAKFLENIRTGEVNLNGR